MISRRVVRPSKKPGWWTPERQKAVWDMYVEGESFEDIAEHFGVTIAAAQRQIYAYKKGQAK